MLEVCQRFATSPERILILRGFIAFRYELHALGIVDGFQWLDGSFLEDIEAQENRAPRDIDIVTFFWGHDWASQTGIMAKFPEFASPKLAKANFLVDHYPVDASQSPEVTVSVTRYWTQLFSHSRVGVWKGMVQVQLNTQEQDLNARNYLNSLL